jgi:hypothetical protein
MRILHNHIGYDVSACKRAILEGGPDGLPGEFLVRAAADGRIAHRGRIEPAGRVQRWRDWNFSVLDFTPLEQPGEYVLQVGTAETPSPFTGELSHAFRVQPELLYRVTVADVLDYFKSQRCSGDYDLADQQLGFVDHPERPRVDVRGGWHDASGDRSKYLSHLSYANFLNPQHTPMVSWVCVHAANRIAGLEDVWSQNYVRRLRDEAAHGGDFLVRMQDPEGYFYATVFDNWSWDPARREICAYRTQKGIKLETWQAALRQGGGMAVAALAKLAAAGVHGAEFGPDRYLSAAVKGWDHLAAHNLEYCPDGKENIIDDYCALVAAVELVRATGDARFLAAARERARSLVGRQMKTGPVPGWWRADDGERPYFHAVEAGLPAIALCEYLSVEPEDSRKDQVRDALHASLRFELEITGRVTNPFGYARQYTKPVSGPPREAFFVPHDNESGYWWQGEDARLASLAAAARMAARVLGADARFAGALRRYADDQLNWILGQNPFDVCMLHGHGHNSPEYFHGNPPSSGGIANGITSGEHDEDDIGWDPPEHRLIPDQSWRWTEQWIPHSAWYLLAVAG